MVVFFLSGAKRNYNTNRYDDGSGGPPKREFNRSLSSENWRDRGGNEEEEEDGDWRRAGGSKWSKFTGDGSSFLLNFESDHTANSNFKHVELYSGVNYF